MLVASLAVDYLSKSRQVVTEDTRHAKRVDCIILQQPNVLLNRLIPATFLPVSSIPFTNSYELDSKTLEETANLPSDSELPTEQTIKSNGKGDPVTYDMCQSTAQCSRESLRLTEFPLHGWRLIESNGLWSVPRAEKASTPPWHSFINTIYPKCAS